MIPLTNRIQGQFHFLANVIACFFNTGQKLLQKTNSQCDTLGIEQEYYRT